MSDSRDNDRWVGFDLGGTKMLAAVFDEKFRIVARQRKKTKGQDGPEAGMRRIVQTIKEAMKKNDAPARLAGIGIGCPGPVDVDRGVILGTPNLSWRDVPIKKVLEDEFSCEVVVTNDVDAGVYGEYRFGAAQNARCAIGVFPGTGIGGGCVYEGHILRGANSSCMEIGHIPVAPNGRLCGCGQYGCLEAEASRLAIAAEASKAAYRGEAPHGHLARARSVHWRVRQWHPEVNRVTYLSIQPLLKAEPALAAAQTIVTEVGGGSTELLLIKEGNVAFSHTYRLGSLRLRKTLEAYRAPTVKVRGIMETHISRTVDQIRGHLPGDEPVELVAMGGDVRFAASQLISDRNPKSLARIPLAALGRFTNEILELSEDELVRKYHLSFPDAETVGPALLAYVLLARAFKLKHVLVTNANLRDGLLTGLASQEAWTQEFSKQIVRSALDLGRKFQFDEAHATHVANLSKELFHGLADEHHLSGRYEIILYTAALLHEIGLFVSSRSYHKHSMYLIRNSELFGFSKNDVLLVALVARYHRRASPLPSHEGYATLDREQRVAVAKMAAILRVAVALDESRSQRIAELRCSVGDGRLIISIAGVEDLSLEQLALNQNVSLFAETFGMQVLLRRVSR